MHIKVWDLPLRIFHWSLTIAVVAAITTGKIGAGLMDWHARCGAIAVGLLAFRILWGFIGTEHARFRNFLPTPSRLKAYFAGKWRGLGHNPLGAVSVIALLGVVALQIGTGLFATDDIAFQGPLHALVDQAMGDRLTHWHEISFYALTVLLSLHLIAIAFYWWSRRTNLVLPMLTGNKSVLEPTPVLPSVIKPWRAVAAAIAASALALATLNAGTFDAPDRNAAEAADQQATAVADW